MNRLEFLKSMGLTGAALLAALTSCQPDSEAVLPLGPVDFDLDLTDPAYFALHQAGGYVIQYGVVVARTVQETFVAVTQTCSHKGQQQVVFKNDEFYCTAHGARYDTTGKGLNTNGKRGLTTYRTEQSGSILRVYA
ncbi:Rieske (2Fe-2S) protein [Tellurirhabdus bombi]|uniref:Rieske (2Fe-2S) protein n=1 Tax=Tellurirhabdus bombi TaxID=2907205 RepID=UPI001F15BF14|nr:Rieske 2Fe-2S domain-containing protein [Tellurirhabdus bombi]